jgi:hypothetical protein
MDSTYDDEVARIYADCHHTKYEGCRPCPHDVEVRRLTLQEMTLEAQEMGLYDLS